MPLPSSSSAFPNCQHAEELTERNLTRTRSPSRHGSRGLRRRRHVVLRQGAERQDQWPRREQAAGRSPQPVVRVQVGRLQSPGVRRERRRHAYQLRQQPQPSLHCHDVDALHVLAEAEKGQHHMSIDQTSWEAAVRHLYEDAYPYDATGPRRHENWVLDVLALMARAPDPAAGPVSMTRLRTRSARRPPPTPSSPTRRSSLRAYSRRSIGTVPRTCCSPLRTTAAPCPT